MASRLGGRKSGCGGEGGRRRAMESAKVQSRTRRPPRRQRCLLLVCKRPLERAGPARPGRQKVPDACVDAHHLKPMESRANPESALVRSVGLTPRHSMTTYLGNDDRGVHGVQGDWAGIGRLVDSLVIKTLHQSWRDPSESATGAMCREVAVKPYTELRTSG
jgi:hypothetical protein